MNEEYKQLQPNDMYSSSLNVFQGYLVNQYKFNNPYNFFSLYPPKWKSFAVQTIVPWLSWSSGKVLQVHMGAGKLIPTLYGSTIIKRTTDLVMSGGLRYTTEMLDTDEDTKQDVSKSTKFLERWVRDTDFNQKLRGGIQFMLEGGTSILKLNCDEDGLWVDNARIDRFLPTFNARGKLVAIKVFTTMLDSTYNPETQNNDNWALVEMRYYNDKNKPVVVYTIEKETGQKTSPAFSHTTQKNDFKTLPKEVKQSFIDAYGNVRINEEVEMPFTDLGCYVLKRTETSSVAPDIPFGDSLLVDAIPNLLSYDLTNTKSINDLYLASGKIYVPGNINPKNAYGDGLADNMIHTSGMMDQHKMEVVQFKLRADEWAMLNKTHYDKISADIGIGTSYIFPSIGNQSAKTAKEISAEASMTTNTIMNIRSLIIPQINHLLNEVLAFNDHKGITANINFSNAGLTNTSLRYEESRNLYQANMISLHTALEIAFPEWSEDRIQTEIKTREKELLEMLEQGLQKSGAVTGQDNHEQTIVASEPKEVKQEEDSKDTKGEESDVEK